MRGPSCADVKTKIPYLTQDGRADMTNFEMDLFDTRMNSYTIEKEESEQCCRHSIIRPACVPITIISLFIVMVVFFPLFNDETIDAALTRYERSGICSESCRVQIVESLPTNISFANFTDNPSTYEVWRRLLSEAKNTIDVAALYWNLRDTTGYPTSWQGNDTFRGFISAAKRNVKIRIAQNIASHQFAQIDSAYLASHGYAKVRNLNFTKLFGSGVLHTKFWIVDSRHIYIGSANMDWKSLTEVKELGYVFWNCSCLASELSKIFITYWKMGVDGAKVPAKWPLSLRTIFNFSNPLHISLNDQRAFVFVSSSPRSFNAKGREEDGDAIVATMEDARRFIHIAVMDYLPSTICMGNNDNNNTYWSKLDDAIRSAAYRGVNVRMLISQWKHSKRQMKPFLRSLLDINEALPTRHNSTGSIQVKFFAIPSNEQQKEISFARVNHNKYMVTDRIAYVGTSNWVGDYFLTTAGVGVALISPELVNSLNAVFLRDWNSQYAHDF
uniref:PLD phosphodiesterase domain-containing protein n=1 Tax=Parascaris univalens TaxID=6257 RepID=A0A915BBJ6_PARUN